MNTKYIKQAFGVYTLGVFALGTFVGAVLMILVMAWRAGW